MATTWKSVDVQCPFYRTDDCAGSIRCEGPQDASFVQTSFTQTQDWLTYMDRYCCADYRSCPMHQMILDEYESI